MKSIVCFLIIFIIPNIYNPLHSQDGRIDTLFSVDMEYEFIFENHVDSNDVLRLDLLGASRGGNPVLPGDTIIRVRHKFYDDFYLEFERNKIYKYVYDHVNHQKFYVYTDDFTMPKGGRLKLAHCMYGHVSYPEAAYDSKVEGLAFVQVFINERGCVVKARPLSRIGYGIEQEVMKAVMQCGCVYRAGKRNGSPIKSIWNIPMRFELYTED